METAVDLVGLLSGVPEKGASDLHLSSGTPPMYRLNGVLVPAVETVLGPQDCRDLVLSGLTEIQRGRLEEEWELDFMLEIQGVGRFRGNAHYSRGNVEAAYRHIPSLIPSLEELGHRPIMDELCKTEDGLILITGTTGSGKSTTLASMIQTISRMRTGVIVTIEDPIEFIFENALSLVKQREVGNDTKSFYTALRHVVRQDPDIIVVTEMRDRETIQAAVTAAETGHLVIGTLHTIDAPKSIDRLVDVFPSEQQNQIVTQISNCLRAIVSQRLLPRADIQGRVIATEVMLINSGIRACLRDRKTQQLPGLIEIGGNEGMNTIDQSLAELLEDGYITREEAILNARDPAHLRMMDA